MAEVRGATSCYFHREMQILAPLLRAELFRRATVSVCFGWVVDICSILPPWSTRSIADSLNLEDSDSPAEPYHPRFLHRILHQFDRKAT